MYETPEDFQRLQTLLDQSIEQAGTFLRRSFQMPLHSFSVRQLVHFWQGMQTVAFATVTSKGEPRVAPIDALLVHGRFYIPTVTTAMRTRHQRVEKPANKAHQEERSDLRFLRNEHVYFIEQ